MNTEQTATKLPVETGWLYDWHGHVVYVPDPSAPHVTMPQHSLILSNPAPAVPAAVSEPSAQSQRIDRFDRLIKVIHKWRGSDTFGPHHLYTAIYDDPAMYAEVKAAMPKRAISHRITISAVEFLLRDAGKYSQLFPIAINGQEFTMQGSCSRATGYSWRMTATTERDAKAQKSVAMFTDATVERENMAEIRRMILRVFDPKAKHRPLKMTSREAYEYINAHLPDEKIPDTSYTHRRFSGILASYFDEGSVYIQPTKKTYFLPESSI